MIIVDSEQAEKLKRRKIAEETHARINAWIAQENVLCQYTLDEETSPLNHVRKLGTPLPYQEVERRLAHINPNLVFQWFPFTTYKKIKVQTARGIHDPHIIYEARVMPERSIWYEDDFIDYDPDYGDSIAADPMDYPEHDFVPNHEYAKELGIDSTNMSAKQMEEAYLGEWKPRGPLPGMKRIRRPAGEKIRGYRTIGIRLVQAGLATPSQVEAEFSSDNTPEWQQAMGKVAKSRPWVGQ